MLQEVIHPRIYQRITNEELIEDRAQDIQRIEEDTIEIFDIMTDLDRLVESQDDDIIHLEDNITGAHNNIKKATDDLNKANKKKKNRKWGKITAFFVGILIIIGGICIFII